MVREAIAQYLGKTEFEGLPDSSSMFKPYKAGGDAWIVQLEDNKVVRIRIGVD